MANQDVKRGLVPVRMASGSYYNNSSNPYYVPATNAAPLFQGDPVVITGEGSDAGLAIVERAAAAGPITGVIVGFRPEASRDVMGYLPANTAGIALVADDPHLECEIQINGPLAAGDIGQNAALAVVDGDPVYRRSNVELDQGTIGAGAGLPVRILATAQRADNDPYDAAGLTKVRVRLNNVTTDADSAGE